MAYPVAHASGVDGNRYYTANQKLSSPPPRGTPSRIVNDDSSSDRHLSHHGGAASNAGSNQSDNANTSRSACVESRVNVVPSSGRRRRVVQATALDNDGDVSKYYDALPDDNLQRSTVCMDHHVLARMEADLRRAEMRRANPDSGIPDRGDLYEQELEACLAAQTPVRSARRSLSATPSPARKKTATAAFHLPPICPPPDPPRRRHSRSRQSSGCSTPQHQQHQQQRRSTTDNNNYNNYNYNNDDDNDDDSTADFIARERAHDSRRRPLPSLDNNNNNNYNTGGGAVVQRNGRYPLHSEAAYNPWKRLTYDEPDAVEEADTAGRRPVDEEIEGFRESGLIVDQESLCSDL